MENFNKGFQQENNHNLSDFNNSLMHVLSEFDLNALEANKLSSPIIKYSNLTSATSMSFREKLKNLPDTINCSNSTSFGNYAMPQNTNDQSFYGLPSDVEEILKRNYDIISLYDWQIECLKFCEMNKNLNLIYSLPTSGGKTLVAELLILKQILCHNKNALLVLPYVSIVQEKVRKMSVYADSLGFLLEEYAGNKGHFPPKARRSRRTLYVATIEKANSLIDHFLETIDDRNGLLHPINLMSCLGIVVIDELHMIGIGAGSHRSSTMEALISKIRYYESFKSNKDGPIKLIGMSATLSSNALGLHSFMGALSFTSDFRPVELKEYLKINEAIYSVQNEVGQDEPKIELFRKLTYPPYYNDRLKALDPQQVFILVAETLTNSATERNRNISYSSLFDESTNGAKEGRPIANCLVFCPTKKNCENVALNMARIADVVLRKRRQALKMLDFLKNRLGNNNAAITTNLKSPTTSRLKSSRKSAGGVCSQKVRMEKIKCELRTLPRLDHGSRTLELRNQLITNLGGNGDSFVQHQLSQSNDRLGDISLRQSTAKICPILRKAIRYGIAYHHSGLTTDERKIIEEAYSSGILSVICCTSTLAAGVNLPAKRVILKSPSIGTTVLNAGQYRQMIGRAGRAGLITDTGESFLILNDPDRQKVLIPSILGKDPSSGQACASGMPGYDMKGFKNLFLSAIGLGIAKTEEELGKLYQHTLYAHQLNASTCELEINKDSIVTPEMIIKDLSNAKLIQSDPTQETKSPSYSVSKLGRAIYRSTIDQKYCVRLYKDLVKSQEVMVLATHLHLLFLVTPYEINGFYTVDWHIYVSEVNRMSAQELKVMEVIGIPESYLIGQMTCQGTNRKVNSETVARFYCTLMLYRLWKRETFWDVSQYFQVDRGFVQNLFQNSTSFAYSLYNFTMEFDELWALRELLEKFVKKFHHIVSKDLIPLIDLPGVKIGRIRQLYNAGYRSLIQVAQAKPDNLVKDIQFLPRKLAQEIIASAKVLLKGRAESLEDEAINILSQLASC